MVYHGATARLDAPETDVSAAFFLIGLAAAAVPATNTGPSTAATFDAIAQRLQTDPPVTGSNIRIKRDPHARMTVSVRLADAGPYQFLVDTGADRTSVSRDIVESLKLKPGPDAQLHTVAGSSVIQTARMPALTFGRDPVQLRVAPVLERVNVGADGILALDSLRSQRVQFDFRNKTMSVTPSAKRHRDEAGTIVVTARARGGRLVLSRATADGFAVTIVLDTGSELCIGNEALRAKLSRNLMRAYGKVELQSVTGATLAGEYTFLRELKFGGAGLKDVAIVFADAHTFKQLGLENEPALLLGMNAMRAFDLVTIDFAEKKLRLVVPRGRTFMDNSYAVQ